ncbi:2-methylcitrate dehydratase PrpD [Jatrophihabitans endophyticus]|uniref:2-methylcitrate dehydratase PrpD n=1 Tax=Jatrophihabitans endophyticus TaxID=1206085 RepID=A0A1M5PVT8_9ACTN|nr:MmgE/PrpD family protein [Jatrophihabitans endophyticus]SHH05812.1 2-methylcitrate dehydratase PrpD [Jatrophihabitans endophyticus]
MHQSAELAGFAAGLRVDAAPAAVVTKLRTNLLHNLGMLRAGALTGISSAGLAAALPYDGPSAATLLHDGTRTHRDRAVVANAAMMHASARDDTYLPAIAHLAVTSLPALLAVGETLDSSGADLMAALLASYEVGAAVGVDVGPACAARGFRPSSVLGGIAAAAGVARLLGLDAGRTASAIGLAAAFGGGTGQTWLAGTDEWQYQVGVAGRNGLLAAELAASGAIAAPDSLEGAAGLYPALTGSRTPHAAAAALGTRWRVLDVTYKPYPICAINQMPVTVVVAMGTHFGYSGDQVDAVRVLLPPSEAAYPGTDRRGPFASANGALMSAPFCLAAGILHGTVTRGMLEAVDDVAVTTLARRIEVVADPDLTPGRCRIVVHADGTEHDSDTLPTPPGFDWTFAEVHRRLADAADQRGLSDDALQRLVDCIAELEHRRVRDLVTAIVRE